MFRIRKKRLNFLERIMRKKVLGNFNQTRLINDNGDMGRQRTNNPNGLYWFYAKYEMVVFQPISNFGELQSPIN